MHLDPLLLGALADLTAALDDPDLDDPDLDIAAGMAMVGDRTRDAVPSYLGLAVETVGRDPVGFTTLGPDAATVPSTSLTFTAPGQLPDAPTIALTLYASTPGAFVDLAADVSWSTSRHDASVVLDQHLDLDRLVRADTLQASSTVNQAIGVLIDRGLPPDDARCELDARAEQSGTDRVGAAEQVLASIGPGA